MNPGNPNPNDNIFKYVSIPALIMLAILTFKAMKSFWPPAAPIKFDQPVKLK